jgi:hypothetical protein
VPERYEDVLQREIGLWQELEALARQQRQAVIQRRAQDLDDLRGDLREQLRLALMAHQQSLKLKPPAANPEQLELSAQADRAQLQARDAIRLNLELLRDTCSYLEMIRSVITTETVPARYGRAQAPRPLASSAHSRVA